MNAIELRGISKRYNIYDRPIDRLKEILWRNTKCFHKEFWTLKNLDLDIRAGQTTAILGPNGSGKSTLLQIIAGVLQPTAGFVHAAGRITAILELGAGFQPEYTGRENVLLNGMILGISREEMLSRMDEIAAFAEIGDFFDQPIKTYSSGMVVRLAFAVAITVDPDILLIDEALAVGDQSFQTKCFSKLKELQEANKTIVVVTHDMKGATRHTQWAVLLNGGKIMAQGKTEDIVPLYEDLMVATGAITPKIFVKPKRPALST